MKVCMLTLTLLFIAAPAIAADPTGNWSGSVATGNGDFTVAFSLKADGEHLTGTMKGPDGNTFTIEDGKVEGDNISFFITVTFNGNSYPLAYKGVVSEEEIKFTFEVNNQAFPFVVKRVK